jgi:hypothetical protein
MISSIRADSSRDYMFVFIFICEAEDLSIRMLSFFSTKGYILERAFQKCLPKRLVEIVEVLLS